MTVLGPRRVIVLGRPPAISKRRMITTTAFTAQDRWITLMKRPDIVIAIVSKPFLSLHHECVVMASTTTPTNESVITLKQLAEHDTLDTLWIAVYGRGKPIPFHDVANILDTELTCFHSIQFYQLRLGPPRRCRRS